MLQERFAAYFYYPTVALIQAILYFITYDRVFFHIAALLKKSAKADGCIVFLRALQSGV